MVYVVGIASLNNTRIPLTAYSSTSVAYPSATALVLSVILFYLNPRFLLLFSRFCPFRASLAAALCLPVCLVAPFQHLAHLAAQHLDYVMTAGNPSAAVKPLVKEKVELSP
jgi:hypothetical protein